jgi:hypothetical protein
LNAKALEDDRRSFYKQMSELEGQQANQFQSQNRRLGWLAFWVALVIGSIQIITALAGVTPDALGYRAWCYFAPSTCSPISKPESGGGIGI